MSNLLVLICLKCVSRMPVYSSIRSLLVAERQQAPRRPRTAGRRARTAASRRWILPPEFATRARGRLSSRPTSKRCFRVSVHAVCFPHPACCWRVRSRVSFCPFVCVGSIPTTVCCSVRRSGRAWVAGTPPQLSRYRRSSTKRSIPRTQTQFL